MLLLLVTIVVGLVVLYMYKLAQKNESYWKKKGVKSIKSLPLVGNMLPLVTQSMSIPDMIDQFYYQYPDERYVGIYQFLTPILLMRDIELIKSVAIKNFEHFIDHTGFLPPEVDPIWGKNLFSSTGDRWRDLRQTLSPVFTSSKMRTMFVLMEKCVHQLINHLEEYNKDVVEAEMKDIFSRYTTDVIATTAFGIECDSLKNTNNEFLRSGRDLSDLSGIKRFKFFLYGNFPTLAKLLKIRIVSTKVANFFRSLIDETISIRETKKIQRPDMIHLLMLARKGKLKYEELLNQLNNSEFAAVNESFAGKKDGFQYLSNEDITAQAVVFFLGGFDTTSTLMCFTGYELAVNPDVQRKLKEEIRQTHQNCNGQLTYDVLLQMKYLDMVTSEVLRKWTQAIWLDRKCTKKFEIPAERPGEVDVTVNVGDVVWFPIWSIHRDPKYYPDPEKFDPERFSDENKDKIQFGTYLPFGTGPRNCIGSRFALLGSKIVLYHLLLNFDFVPTSKTKIPLKIAKDTPFLQPENGYHLGLKRNKIIC